MPVNTRTLLTQIRTQVGSRVTPLRAQVTRIINRFPLMSFIVLLAALVGMIALGNQLRKPKTETVEAQPVVKEVEVYTLDSSPQITVQAQVEKSGIIKLVAQTGGVVQKIKATEGDHVTRGQSLFSLSTNYQGGNVMSVSRQISYKTYKNTVDTYPLQKDSLNANRDLARKSETQQADLRSIARQSIDETKTLITLNEQVVNGLDEQIRNEEAGAADVATLTQLRSMKAQFVGALNGLRSGLRNTEYVNDENQEPAEVARLTRDNTLRQLDIQEKALELSKDLALLNLRIAQINESLMFPAAPCPGTIERVYVKIGQNVTPGTILATIRGDDNTASAVALVSSDIAQGTSRWAASTASIEGQPIMLQTRYISQEPTDGVLHAITFSVPDEIAPRLTNGSYIQVELPVGVGLYDSKNVYIPLDAVYQTQAGASVFITTPDGDGLKAQGRSITLGQVYGRFVEVLDGVSPGDQVIVNRNVIQDDLVSIK
jgi:multidrug efflux pump subunit AcrA (membrane-fusion protein)